MLKFLSPFIAFLSLLSTIELKASDTVTVQTLTFDSIYTRRGVWTFPDNPNEYRKILMSYKLKCDPKTPHDRFNCGEWDYLTYNVIHKHTGEFDTIYANHPRYLLARTSPDTINYSLNPQTMSYQIKKTMRKFESGTGENIYSEFNSQNMNMEFPAGNNHIQFLIPKDSIRNSSLENNVIHRMQLKTNLAEGDTINNIKIKAAHSSDDNFTTFQNQLFTELYDYMAIVGADGIVDIVFNEEFKTNPLRGVLFDIAFESDITFELSSIEEQSVNSYYFKNDKYDYFAQFDGTNDYIKTSINEELSGVNKFSVEGWFKVDEWKSWTHLFGKGGRTGIELGPEEGQIYCMVRSIGNTHGNVKYAVQKGKWFHLAMVYDGIQEDNRDKLRLFINGDEKILTYTGILPSKTEVNDLDFTISSLRHNTSALSGAADNIRVWNKVLAKEEIISRMYINDLSEEPDAANLLANIYFNEASKNEENIESAYQVEFFGKPQIELKETEELLITPVTLDMRPVVNLFQYEDFSYTEEENIMTIEEEVEPVSIYEYAPEGYDVDVVAQTMVWLPGYQYSYDYNGNKIDSTYYEADETLINEEFEYSQGPQERIIKYEIGRFITPYGINLDLGPDGFEWMYDVTDYAPLLTGEVDMSAGNLQELIDIKFYFIKGTPPRKVMEITQIWGERSSHSYANLDNDVVLNEKEIQLHPDARQFKVKTRLTGHGHQSNTGSAPHCCEWKDNTHYLYVNGEEVADWKIFRYTECGENPVFPQGGTWPGAREGWCPGDVVYDYEYEISDYITGNTATFDYDITDVPANNQGMGKGNYQVAMQLIQYEESEFDTDAELYDIMAPSNWDYYSRKNPICLDPKFKVRNNGKEPITSLKIKYGVSGNEMQEESFSWNLTPIMPNEIKEIDLFVESSDFWLGDGSNIFTIEITEVNGQKDEYSENDIYYTEFNMPDLYNSPVVIVYKTNARATHFNYEIFDTKGEMATNLNPSQNNRVYRDTLRNTNECMTLRLVDQYSYGLSYWAYPDQGNGFVRIEDINGNILKSFDPDFGRGLFYSFRLGEVSYVNDAQFEYLVNLFPNPAKDILTINSTVSFGDTEINLYDLLGNKLLSINKFINEGNDIQLDISEFATGDYFLEFNNGEYRFTKRFLKK
jgi:hypothetical protein